MRDSKHLILSASSLAILAGGGAAYAQESDDLRQDEVIVTGSFIEGSSENAAAPVDIITDTELELQGNPSLTELIRNLGVSNGTDGETNQFASNGLEGTANVNLRGLGPARTLVLINGKRQTFSPYAIGEQAQLFVDTNMIPAAAIGRVEILKEGAAALYGSDAIAGVVNFITKDDLDGLELSAEYETFEGSDGNINLSAAYGKQFDNGSWVTSLGYNTRAEVPLLEKDWAILSFAENPVGGWSTIGNPGSFVATPNIGPGSAVAGTALAFANADENCNALGGIDGGVLCRFQFTQFDNLVEEEERLQLFSEFNYQFGDTDFHLEFLFANTEVPEWKTSPSYPPQSLFGQLVLPDHPGLQQFIVDNPGWAAATYTDYAPLLAGGAPVPNGLNSATTPLVYFGRTFGFGGFPGTGGAQEGRREHNTIRLATSLEGEFDSGVNWELAASYSQAGARRETNDTYIFGLQKALQGLGGPNCVTNTPGANGCLYYNPFSNAIATNAITGAANPQYNPALANSPELAEWLTETTGTEESTGLLVLDAIFNGQSSIELAGGNVGWATGFQVRNERFESDPNDVSDLAINPCSIPGDQVQSNGVCPTGESPTGPFAFLAGQSAFKDNQTIFGAFVEVGLPISDTLSADIAARYERYPGSVGHTFDPKLAVKWQATPELSLRGAAQTSFRGPTLNQLDGQVTTLQFVGATGAFKAVDQFGNPDLDPESATSFDIGAIWERDNFRVSLDYYNFDFSDPIIVEEQTSIVNAALAAIGAGNLTDPILGRITFDGGNVSAGGISRIRTNVVNGPDIKTSGVDFRAEYGMDVPGLMGNDGQLDLGFDATYVLEYDVADFQIEGTTIAGGDRVGQFNRSNFSRSLPEYKANLTANYATGPHNVRAILRHIASYDDERGDLTGNGTSEIEAHTTMDLFYNLSLETGTRIGLSVVNVTDEDPPFAQFDLNYDPYTHNPFGRTFKISVTQEVNSLFGK